ncbi:MAG: hypothetical protein ACRENX_05950 [Candidatus Dormibacteria bacterium]
MEIPKTRFAEEGRPGCSWRPIAALEPAWPVGEGEVETGRPDLDRSGGRGTRPVAICARQQRGDLEVER